MKTRLTKSEMEIMEVLWDEGKALTTSEKKNSLTSCYS